MLNVYKYINIQKQFIYKVYFCKSFMGNTKTYKGVIDYSNKEAI